MVLVWLRWPVTLTALFLVLIGNAAGYGAEMEMETLVLPLQYEAHDSPEEAHTHDKRRGRMLAGRGMAMSQLEGDVLTKGYYFVTIQLGTPGQKFTVVVDSGSTTLYVPCSSCRHCGKHADPRFNAKKSSTHEWVSCKDPHCESQSCDRGGRCIISGSYAEGSSTEGIMASDIITFMGFSTIHSSRVFFECETKETGELYKQKVDGIIGMGRGKSSVVTQLAKAGVMDDAFSICFGGSDVEAGGALIMGKSEVPKDMVFAPFDSKREGSPFYSVELVAINVNGKAIDVKPKVYSAGYGAILDSGTTYTMMPQNILTAFRSAMKKATKAEAVPGPLPDQMCWKGVTSLADAKRVLPKVEFVFANGAKLKLAPENLVVLNHKRKNSVCLGYFKGTMPGILLGGITTRNMLVRYDRGQKQVGFAKRGCKELLQHELKQSSDEL